MHVIETLVVVNKSSIVVCVNKKPSWSKVWPTVRQKRPYRWP